MTFQHRLSDQELVALLKTGNQAEFTEIYDRYWRIMYGRVYKCCSMKKKRKMSFRNFLAPYGSILIAFLIS